MALPPAPRRLDDLELTTTTGTVVRLSELADRPLVIPLVRYYGCMPCRDYLLQLEGARASIEGLGCSIVGVGGAADYQAKALMDDGVGYQLLLDPDHRLYQALAVDHFPWWKLLSPDTWRRYLRAARRARQGKITGHPLQAPGLVVLDTERQVRYLHRGQTLGDYPTIDDLLVVLADVHRT